MRLEGKVYKHTRHWIAEIHELDVMSQGTSRKQAVDMVADAINLLADKDLTLNIHVGRGDAFSIESGDPKPLLALLLKRQRTKQGLSIRDVAKRLNSNSPNAYAQYERGKSEPSVSMLDKILKVIMPQSPLFLKMGV